MAQSRSEFRVKPTPRPDPRASASPLRPRVLRAGVLRAGVLRLGRGALDLLLPPRCVACDAAVAVQGQLCAQCFGLTNFITDPTCVRCGVGFTSAEQGNAAGFCPTCEADPPVFRQARAALRYDDQARRLILPLKHADRTDLAHLLGPMMERAGKALLDRADVLVPVPLHRRRLFTRRYNQAALLAGVVGRRAGLPVLPDGLIRTRQTAPLDDKSPEERAREIDGSIAVRPARVGQIVGRVVLLVDDVMTSRATANACSAALLAAGASAVDVLVAARVPDPGLG